MLRLFIFLVLFLNVNLVKAAEIKRIKFDDTNPRDVKIVYSLSGDIARGDAEKLIGLIKEKSDYPDDVFLDSRIELNSLGGSYQEAVELLDVFYKYRIGTYVGKGAECLSACAIAFMGGTDLNDAQVIFTNRVIHPEGRLGFHAPSLGLSGKGSIPAELLNDAYAEALVALGEVISRMEKFDIRRNLVETIIKTPPALFYDVTTIGEAARWGISLDIPKTGWAPSNLDIVRLCMNWSSWSKGNPSIYRWFGPNWIDRDAGSKEARWTLEEEKRFLQNLRFWSSNRNQSSAKKIAYLKMLEFDYDEYCLVEIYRSNGAYSFIVHDTTADPLIKIQEITSQGLFGAGADRQHTFPADLKLSDLKAQIRSGLTNRDALRGQSAEGYCKVYKGSRLIEQKSCKLEAENFLLVFVWPSGAKTVVEQGTLTRINGSVARSVNALNGEDFCYLNSRSGNTFCFQSQ